MRRTLHIGIVGLGARGFGCSQVLAGMQGVHVDYVCDVYEDRCKVAADYIKKQQGYRPLETTNYEDLLKSDIEAVMLFTSWEVHIPQAIAAMKAGKWVGMEVGGAYSIQDCWDLVHTYEETGIPCMMLENCCYGKRELMVNNMVVRGVFGEIVHCEGGYHHDLRLQVSEGVERRHYRQRNYLNRNCHNYPTHDFGPIAKVIGINRGNRPLTLVSMASKSCGIEDFIARTKPDDEALRGRDFALGDVITTIIKCAGGETVTLTLDTSLPRSYSRAFTVQGTRGMYHGDTDTIFMDGEDKEKWLPGLAGNAKRFNHKYLSPKWRPENADKVVGDHGGMDGFVFGAFLDCLDKRDTNVPIDVYDTATWMAITALSEESIALGSMPMAFPDFTNGAWLTREPVYCDDFTQPIPEDPEEEPKAEEEKK